MAYPKLTFFSKDEQALNEMLFSAPSPILSQSKSPTSLVVASTSIEDEIPSSSTIDPKMDAKWGTCKELTNTHSRVISPDLTSTQTTWSIADDT
jgi:hypothetical protein